jgi:hypothetical protein
LRTIFPALAVGHASIVAPWLSSCRWAVVVGVRDARLISEIQRQCPLLLVIEPSRRRMERLRSAWGQNPAGLQFWQEPVGASEEKVRWYSYNDSRLDGRRAPAELSNALKNVSLLNEEWRQARTLGQVVNEWLGTPDSLPEGGVLFLQNSDPEPLIAGAGSLLPSLEHLALWTESTVEWQPASISESLAICLEAACFRRSSHEAFHWEKDERLLLQRQLQSLEALVARLRAENDPLRLENQDMRRRIDELSRLTTNSEQEMTFIRELIIQAGIKREVENT